jgi:DNA-binding LytR/AlgR family response regulator
MTNDVHRSAIVNLGFVQRLSRMSTFDSGGGLHASRKAINGSTFVARRAGK